MVGVAVKVTDVPEQTGLADAEIDMLTGKFGFTVMVTALLVAGLPVAQVEFDVNSQVTTSPVVGVYEYIALFVPTLELLTFHW